MRMKKSRKNLDFMQGTGTIGRRSASFLKFVTESISDPPASQSDLIIKKDNYLKGGHPKPQFFNSRGEKKHHYNK